MSLRLSKRQALIVWKLLFLGEEPAQSKVIPKLPPRERRQLASAGLVRLERRGRATHLVLTEAAWDWANDNLDAELLTSPHATPVLRAVLRRLRLYLEPRGMVLGELFVAPPPPAAEPPAAEVAARVRQAALTVAGGKIETRVRLRDLRDELRDLDRALLDRTLLAMEVSGDLVLYGLDNPAERAAADELAAVDVVGEKRHIVYLNR